MKFESVFLVASALAGACSTVPTSAAEPRPREVAPRENSFHVLIGRRELDEDLWEPVESQGAFGVEFAHEPLAWPVGFEVGFQLGGKTKEVNAGGGDTDVTSAEFELYGGPRVTFLRDSKVQPYVGAGLTLLSAAFEADGAVVNDDDDSSFGFYFHGGVAVLPSDAFKVGIDLRAVRGTDIDLFGVDGDGDYEQAAIFVGWAF